MDLQTFAKIGIIVGIAGVVIFSVIATIGASNQITENWMLLTLDKDKEMKKMRVLPSVLLFTEKFESHHYQEHSNRHSIGIELIAYNFETGNEMKLDVNYDIWDEEIVQRVRCDIDDSKLRKSLDTFTIIEELSHPHLKMLLKDGRADGSFTHDFIKYTNCLEIGNEENPVRKVSAPQYGEIPTFTISVPQGSSVPGCEEIAHCFEPEEITIKEGQIIEWKNYDDAMHTVTSGSPQDGPTGLFDSGLAEPDATYAIKFEVAGNYPYFCMIHPWQEGSIIVTK